MTANVAGIDPHQDSFTVGIIDSNGIEIHVEAFTNTGRGYVAAVELMRSHCVEQVGVEGSASWGCHVAVAAAAAGFDAREVPPRRSAAQRRGRRLDKTDHVDAVATARALLAEPSLGPVQALDAYDPLIGEDRGRARPPALLGRNPPTTAAFRE
ncbi:MAG: IS110 family transposase [bacterium]|nr:IS110 family transposase [bacterium]